MSNVIECAVYKDRGLPTVSYQCLICEKAEDDKADCVNTAFPWLCPECRKKLRNLMEGVE